MRMDTLAAVDPGRVSRRTRHPGYTAIAHRAIRAVGGRAIVWVIASDDAGAVELLSWDGASAGDSVDPDDLVHLARQRRSGPDLRSTRVARGASFLGPWVELGQRVAA